MIIIFNPPCYKCLWLSILMIDIGNFNRPVFNKVFITFGNDGILGGGKDVYKVSNVR